MNPGDVPPHVNKRFRMATNILIASVTIQGTRPLLWNHFGPDAIPADGKKERTGVAGNDPTEWQRSVLMTKDRQLYLEPSNVFGAIRDGAKHTPRKRGSLQPFVAATLQVQDERVLIDRHLPPEPLPTDPDAPVYVDTRSVKNPTTKGRNVRHRVAASRGWSAKFKITWDKTVVSRGEMEQALIDAGMLVGIGDGRSIGFGRFTVEEFSIITDQ
jgi:hypothetical protein